MGQAEGPDMKCMKTHKGKGLCKKSFQDCDSDSECNTAKGEKCCNNFVCCSAEIHQLLTSSSFDCCSKHSQELLANEDNVGEEEDEENTNVTINNEDPMGNNAIAIGVSLKGILILCLFLFQMSS